MKLVTDYILSDKYQRKISELFERKKWVIETLDDEISEFDRFCERLAYLDTDAERDLILELAEEYLKVSLSDYEKMLVDVWREYFKEHTPDINDKEWLCICPLLPESDFDKVKSSTTMLYLCQALSLRRFCNFSEENIRICRTPKMLVDYVNAKKIHIGELVLIDDYIGTGETGISCLTYIGSKLQLNKERISILSLVAQQEGIQTIEDNGVKVFTAHTCKKGISDRKESKAIIDSKKIIMEQIENKLKVESKYQFGFGKSEALVSMIKTPNNTFPFFWLEKKNIKALAPFPRKDNVKML